MPIRSCWFPLCLAALMLTAMIVAYILAATRNHVYILWPYISDDSVGYPESNIFAQLLDIAAFFGIISIYFRYLIVDAVSQTELTRLNKASLVLGVLSSASLTIIGNFQENLGDYVHDIGAAMLFGLGTIFIIVDTVISFKIRDRIANGHVLAYIRCAIAATSIVFLILFNIGKRVSESQWKASHDQHLHWKPSDPSYSLHVLGSTSEWIVSLMFVCYFATFANEFRVYTATVSLETTYVMFSDRQTPCESGPSAISEPSAVYRPSESVDSVTLRSDSATERTPLHASYQARSAAER